MYIVDQIRLEPVNKKINLKDINYKWTINLAYIREGS